MITKKLRLFTAGAYRKNARDLDRLSAGGLQLRKAGVLRYEFETDPAVCRHALDYCPGPLDDDELSRRKAAFLDAGWELVDATATGWRFFRKAYDPALPETAYESPCPRTGEEDRKIALISALCWARVPFVAVGAVLAVIAVVRGKGMVLPAIGFGLGVLVLSMAMLSLQERLKP